MDFKFWHFVVILLQCKLDTVREDLQKSFAIHQVLFNLMKKAWSMDSNYLDNAYYQMMHTEFENAGMTFDKQKKQLDTIRNAINYYASHGIK